MTLELGTTSAGTVVKVTDYGAIVRLDSGRMGLVHISEIANAYVRDVRDYLNEGDRVSVMVLRENDKGRYELSLKQCNALPPPPEPTRREHVPVAAAVGATTRSASGTPSRAYSYTEERPAASPRLTFEDQLTRFLRESEERQHELKRHMDTKRGRR